MLPSGGYYVHTCMPVSHTPASIDSLTTSMYVHVSHDSRLHASNSMDIEHKGSFTLWILKPTLDELFGFSCWPQEDIMYIRADMPVPVLQLLLIHWLPADVERNSRLCTSNILNVKHERSITKYVRTYIFKLVLFVGWTFWILVLTSGGILQSYMPSYRPDTDKSFRFFVPYKKHHCDKHAMYVVDCMFRNLPRLFCKRAVHQQSHGHFRLLWHKFLAKRQR